MVVPFPDSGWCHFSLEGEGQVQVGKLPTERLSRLLAGGLGARRADVLVAPGIGEDCSVIDFGEQVCIMSTDPITGTVSDAGWLAVHVSCNDVASSGGEPIGVQLALLLPESADDDLLRQIMEDANRACTELGIAILGGHTEILSSLGAPLVVATAIGRCPKGKHVTSKGHSVGDAVMVVKSVGLEGSAILAADFAHLLSGIPADLVSQARTFSREISVVQEAMAARDAGVTAMHDITEGGLYGACLELAQASGLGLRIYSEQVPVREATAAVCDALGLDPLGLISSGSLILTTPHPEVVAKAMDGCGSVASVVGEVVSGGYTEVVRSDGRLDRLLGYYEDELWKFMRKAK